MRATESFRKSDLQIRLAVRGRLQHSVAATLGFCVVAVAFAQAGLCEGQTRLWGLGPL